MKRHKHFFRSALSNINLVKNLQGQLKKIGQPPGTLVFTGEDAKSTKISLIKYDRTAIEQTEISDLNELLSNLNNKEVCWITVTGFADKEKFETIGKHFGIHPLILEDILNVEQQPKFEKHDAYVFLTINTLDFEEATETITKDHFSIIRVGNTVISFMNQEHDNFNTIIDRLMQNLGVIRNKPGSYLVYRLIDTVVDHYYYIINKFNDRLSNLETALLEAPKKEHIHEILHYKKQMQLLRKSIDPWKEANRNLLALETNDWPENEKVFLTDVFDHVKQISGHLDAFSENLRSLTDLYMSIVSNKMNEVMKTLTIVATVFIPLTFVVGIYGMNFVNIPELQWQNGYYYTLIGMGIIGIIMFIYMKTKHWF